MGGNPITVVDPTGKYFGLDTVACIGGIGLFITANLSAASKVRHAGGALALAKRLIAAEIYADRYKAVTVFFGDLVGIPALVEACG